MSNLTTEQSDRALELYRQYFRQCTGIESSITDTSGLSPVTTEAWLHMEEFILQSHECPSTDRRALGHYRHPRMDGQTECPECGYLMHEHGWLDCGGDGIVVCPSLRGPFGGQAVTDHARNHTCPDVESDERIRAWLTIAAHPFFADCYSMDGTLTDAMLAKLDAAHNQTCEPVDDLLEALMDKVLPPEQNASPTEREAINMNNLSDEQYARALELRNVWANATLGGREATTLDPTHACAWLALEKHVLESRKSEWRLVTRDEIQEGWEVRTCDPYGTEATWGIAHHQDNRGDWFTEARARLTYSAPSWIYETTAPAPEPNPRVEALAQALHDEHCDKAWPCESNADYYRKRARKLLASFNDLMES